MQLLQFLTLAAVVCVAVAMPSVYIDPFGSDTAPCTVGSPCATLQHALSVVDQSGRGIIYVANGYYYGQTNFPTISFSVTIQNSVYQQTGAVFDAQGQSLNSITLADSNITVTFTGLTFQNFAYYGAIQTHNGQNAPVIGIYNCVFINNVQSVVFYNNGALTIEQTSFYNYTYSNYAQILVDGGSATTATVYLSYLVFTNIGYGIEIIHAGATVTLAYSAFSNGAYAVKTSNFFVLDVTSSTFTSNTACSMTLQNSNSVSGSGAAVLTGVVFDSNGYSSAGNGGAMYIDSGVNAKLTSCKFTNNTASYDGGAIYCANGAALAMISSTVTGNSASDGGGVWCAPTCASNGRSNVVQNNRQSQDSGPCHGM